jgi:hypothetical protein
MKHEALHWFQFSAEVRKRGVTVPLYHVLYLHTMTIDSARWKIYLSLLLAVIANFPQIRSVHDLFLGVTTRMINNSSIFYIYVFHKALAGITKKTCSLIIVIWIINGYVNCSNYWFTFRGLLNDIVCNPSYIASISCMVCYKVGKALVHIALLKFAGGVFKFY